MNLDRRQLEAVKVRSNVVVSAGAGSGKTRVLTERYVDLVVSGAARIPQILALTFTRKAATEMFGRIHAALLEQVRSQPGLQEQLAAFDEAQIATIDSFCAAVLRDGATGLGLPPVFEVNETGSRRANEIAAARFLAEHSEHPIFARFIRQSGVEKVTDDLLLPILDHHMRVSRPLDFADIEERRSRWISKRIAETERAIDDVVTRAVASSPEDPYFLEVREALGQSSGDYDGIAVLLASVNFRKGKKNESTQKFKELLKEISDRKSGFLTHRSALYETRDLEDDTRTLHELLAGWQEVVLADRRRSGSFGYQEIMELAVQALLSFPDLLASYRRRFRYIMIDEFQDNNQAQRDLLFVLAGDPNRADSQVPEPTDLAEGKLFFVGDQKQSIYRFRGADVRVFKRLSRQIDRSITLLHNYRSEPGLIEFFNRFFTRVFSGNDEDFEAEFETLKHRGEPRDDTRCGVTIAYAPVNPEAGEWADNAFAEGHWIANEIRRLIDAEGYRGDQVAILLRSGSNQQKYERMLRQRGIPYQTQILRSLFLEAPAADLYALLQLHYYPRDRASYAAVLRSPFVMASDEALWRVLRGERRESFADNEDLSATDRKHFAVGRELLAILDAMLDRAPLHIVLEVLWERSGYRYALLSRSSDHGYLEHFDYLVTIARSYEDRPAIEFVEFLRMQIGKSEKIDEIDAPRRPGAVQIMTIHKSKGLEFPVVFVADTDARPTNITPVVSLHEDIGLTIRMPPVEPGESRIDVFARRADEEEQAQEIAERKRLLYVAATRAETRLYATASLKKTEVKPGDSMWEMICSALGLSGEGTETWEEFTGEVTVEQIPPLKAERLRDRVEGSRRIARSEWEALPATIAVIESTAQEIETSPTAINEALVIARGPRGGNDGGSGDRGMTGTPGGRETALALGTLTHLLLELRMRDGLSQDAWLAVPFEVEATLLGDRELDETLLREAWELSEAFLDSQLRRDLSSTELRFEEPFLYSFYAGGVRRYVRGQFDLVALTSEYVHVIDFKTDRGIDPQQYDGQMALYIAAARALYARPVGLSLFALREGRAIAMEPSLEEILPEILGSAEAKKYLGWDLSSDGPLM